MRNAVRTVLVSIAMSASVMSAWADARPYADPSRPGVILAQHDPRGPRRNDNQGVIPLDEILRRLMSQYPGRHLEASGPFQRGNILVYEIIWLTPNGRRILVIVNARTGNVIRAI